MKDLILMQVARLLSEVVSPSADKAGEGVDAVVPVPDGPDLFEIVKNILNTTFGVVGVLAVIMMIVGGVYYMTSQGSPERVRKGKNTILYGIIGLVVCLSAFAIVNFILAGLGK